MYTPKLRPPTSVSNKIGDEDSACLRNCLLAWGFMRLVVSLLWTGFITLTTVITFIHPDQRPLLFFEVPALVAQMIEIGMLVTFIVAGFKKSGKLYYIYYWYCIITLVLFIAAIAATYFIDLYSDYVLGIYITHLFVDTLIDDLKIADLSFGLLALADICLEILLLYLIKKLIRKYKTIDDSTITSV